MYRQVNMTKITGLGVITSPHLSSSNYRRQLAYFRMYLQKLVCVCAVLIRNAAIDGKVMLGGISICPLTC